MFRDMSLKDLNWIDNGKIVGVVHINKKISFCHFSRPFVHNGGRVVESLGRVNYDLLDHFITKSLNHFYSTISEEKDPNESARKITEYNELYQLWYKVNVARQNQDTFLNSYYDDVVYRLYLLGYRNE